MIRKVIDMLFNNFWYKLGALILALIVWGIVQGEEVVERSQRIKVNLLVAPGYAVKGLSYRYIEGSLRGPRVLLGETKPLEAKIQIPPGQVGNLEIPFEKEYLKNWDNRIKLTLRDNYIKVFVDEKVTREVPIREVLQGAPSEGYFIEKVNIKPDRVKVTGIKSEVSKLENVITESIDITGLHETKVFNVTLVDSALGPNAYADNQAKVTIQVGDSRVNKRFTSIPIDYVGSEYVARLKPKTVEIIIQGTPGVLGFINNSDLRAFVELTNIKPGRYERDIQVKIPADTVLIETAPQKASIEVLNQKRKG